MKSVFGSSYHGHDAIKGADRKKEQPRHRSFSRPDLPAHRRDYSALLSLKCVCRQATLLLLFIDFLIDRCLGRFAFAC